MTIYMNRHKRFDEVYPYTYFIKHNKTGKKYHGVRWANVKNNRTPNEDFAIYYFTSSPSLKKDFEDNTQDYTFTIKWTFETVDDAIMHEHIVNERLILKDDWINQWSPKATFLNSDSLEKISSKTKLCWSNEIYRNKQISSTTERWKNPEFKEMVKESHKKRFETMTKEEKLKLSENSKGSKNSHAKEFRFVFVNGDEVIVKGRITKWCKENGIPYGSMRRYINTNETIKQINQYGSILKDYKCYVYSDSALSTEKTKITFKRYFLFDSGEIYELNSSEMKKFLNENGVTYHLIRKFLDKNENVKKMVNSAIVEKIFPFKVYSYNPTLKDKNNG